MEKSEATKYEEQWAVKSVSVTSKTGGRAKRTDLQIY